MESVQEAHGSAGLVVDSADVERVVLIASLKPEAREQAHELLERSAASGEQEAIAHRQGVFLSDRDAVFFFKGREAAYRPISS